MMGSWEYRQIKQMETINQTDRQTLARRARKLKSAADLHSEADADQTMCIYNDVFCCLCCDFLTSFYQDDFNKHCHCED